MKGLEFDGKVVVVTGGTRGLGRAISLEFALKGSRIAITYLQDKASAEDTKNLVDNLGCQAILLQGDITSSQWIESLMCRVIEEFGAVDVLVNNVGFNIRQQLHEITDAEWSRVLDVNLKGTFFCSKFFGMYMFKKNQGSIINIASTAAISPLPRSHHYVAAKSAILGLTKALAGTLAPQVRVNCIIPGHIQTDKWDLKSENEKQEIISNIPLKRPATTSEIARLVSFIALEAPYITGQSIIIDGGLSL